MSLRSKIFQTICGSYVADAAALGFHWLYDRKYLQRNASKKPEFQDPDEKHYVGKVGFFAHPGKKAGDLSQYGETLRLVVTSLLDTNFKLAIDDFQNKYLNFYGYGGEYTGYIDFPTRRTVNFLSDRQIRIQRIIQETLKKMDNKTASLVKQQIVPIVQNSAGKAMLKSLQGTSKSIAKDKETLESIEKMADSIDQERQSYSGANDDQITALSTVPALVSIYGEDKKTLYKMVETAVRTTNNNQLAVSVAKAAAFLLVAIIQNKTFGEALRLTRAETNPAVRKMIVKVQNMNSDVNHFASEYGTACPLEQSFPMLLYIIRKSDSYADAVKKNILVGGDSCGRAILLGAICGALYGIGTLRGIPYSWLSSLSQGKNLSEEIEKLAANMESYQNLQKISSIEQLKQNLLTLEKYKKSTKMDEKHFYQNLIKRGKCFICYKRKNLTYFAPSRFISYEINTIENYEKTTFNNYKLIDSQATDNIKTNELIDKILLQKNSRDKKILKKFAEFCRQQNVVCTLEKQKFWVMGSLS